MKRPRIKIKNTFLDYLLEIVSLACLMGIIILFLLYWIKFPNIIPIHYNISGEADSFGSKWILLILPIAGIFTYFGMTFLNKYPHIFNFPVEVTDQNVFQLYKIGKRTILSLKTVISLMLLYICFAQVLTFVFQRTGMLSVVIILFFVVVVILIPIFAAIAMAKTKNT